MPTYIDLYAIAGQSNAAGRADTSDAGTRFDSLDATTSKAFIYNRSGSGAVEELDFGVNQTYGGGLPNQFGPESEILKLACVDNSKSACVMRYASGGTSMSTHWNVATGTLYPTFVSDYLACKALLISAGYSVIEKGILFSQGETDALNGNPSYYAANQLSWIDQVRTDLGNANLRIGLTLIKVGASLTATYPGVSAVNSAKTAAAAARANVFTIDSTAYALKADDLHYDGSGQIAHGAAFYNGVNNAYQWRKNGVDIAGANSLTLTRNSITGADSGDYSVFVVNQSSGQSKLFGPQTVTVQP